MTTGATFKRGRSKQDYSTPAEFIAAVEAKFGKIDCDLAASAENAKAKIYFTEEQNAFTQQWSAWGMSLCWLNPPFDDIAPWAAKCSYEAARGARILFLTPASVGSLWFAEHVHNKARVLCLRPRLCFDGKAPYPKDCILSVYGLPTYPPGYDLWKWK